MASLLHSESRRLYSWWWDSHISPKNSRWLQENLTDMDAKVKLMIKLIEEDADSFARRAEMYYKKRPELMKLVEESYRAYRALAERYDHAMGALRQAHRTMEEAFPNQVPLVLADDSPSSASAPEIEPHTIGTPHPIRVLFDSDDSQKDALGLSSPKFHPFKRNVALSDEFDSMTSKKGLKQLNDLVGSGEGASHLVKFPEGWVRKGLHFHGEDKKSSECKVETDVNTLKEAITKLEAEKEAGLLQYQKVLEKLSNMESDASCAQEAAKGLNERASKAEAEVEILNQNLTKLEMEREACLVEYQQFLERISSLETKISHDQAEAENEAQNLKQALSILETEKDASLLRYNQCLEKISKMEMKISRYEEDVRILNERADRAETEVWSLKQTIVKLEEEREAAALRCQQCVETISKLETELSLAQEEARRLTIEQRALALELQNGVQMLKDVELRNCGLENEVRRVKDENWSLNEQNLSSDMSIKNLQDEIFSLKEMKEKLEEEVEFQVEQRNALQKEIFCLKEEINDLRRRHIGVIKQVESVGLKPDCLVSSVKGLQDENSNLKEICQKENEEKAILVSTLEIATQNMEKLSEKIALLENFLSAANVELESSREKSKSLEESCLSLGNEKSGLLTEIVSLVSQLKSSQQGLEEIEKRYTELEVKYRSLEEEKESKVRQLEELRASLDLEKQGHASSIKASETRLVHLEDEIHKAQFEIFILQKCIRDMEEKNFSLLIECQKRFGTSKLSEKLISDLEQENLEQQTKIKSLLNQVEILRMGIHQMLKSLKIDPDYVCQDKMREDQTLLQRVLGEIEGMESALLETQDEKQVLLFEKSVLVTLLGQEFNIRTEEVLMLQSEKCELLEINEQLRLEVRARHQRERVLNSELENQCAKLTDLQNVNSKLVQEKGYLMKKFSELKEGNCMLEEENSVILGEAMALGNLSLIFKIYGAEKAEELKGLSDILDHLHGVNGVLEERLRSIEMENLHLKESVEGLGKELSEAEKKLKATESDGLELQRNVKGMKREYDAATVVRKELEKKIVKLSEDNAHHNKDIGCLREENERLELKAAKLLEEIEERKTKEETFSSELQQKSNEVELWETEALTLYGELEISNIRAVLFEEKVRELIRACESFEDERSLKIADIEWLKEILGVLEGENEGMKSELAAYFPIVETLRDDIMSLEDNVFSQAKIRVANNQETVGAVLASHPHDMNYERVNEDQSAKKEIEELKSKTGLVLYLQEVQTRVKAVEKAVMEMIRLGRQESLDTNTKLETAKKEIEELKKSKTGLVQGEGVRIQSRDDPNNLKLTKTESEISNIRNEILMKDIPLDQVLNSSSYDHGFGLRAIGKKENAATDEQMLELWETACHQIEEVVEQKSEHPSSELQGHREGNKRKILETLASDDHKLTNLHVTVENLKNKVAQSEMSKKPKNSAYSIIKGQLEEVEMAIVQLVDINGKLTKNAEEGHLSTDGTRQGSEKIGRLQSEVQRIQFVLLKLDDEQQSKGTTVVTDRKILLRDYLYGVGRNSHGQRQKKVPFCMCVRPPKNVD